MNVDGNRKWWGLAALALSGLVVGLDLTVLNVALPTLATSLDASISELQWFANAYNLVLAAMLLPAGLLGDRFGRKGLLIVALMLFAGASLLCAYAGSAVLLIAARALLGLGAAFLIPLSMSQLSVLFTPEERPRAMGIWILANTVGIPLGPIVGGWLLTNFWWGSVFLINLPLIGLALLAVIFLLPESKSAKKPSIDIPGILLSSGGLVALSYGIIQAGDKGIADPVAVACLSIGAVLLSLFVTQQIGRNRRNPGSSLADLSLFKSKGFTWGTILATLSTFSLFGLLFAIPQFFQAVNGVDALTTGLRLLPIIGGLLVGSRVSGIVHKRTGAKVSVAIGFAIMAGGLFLGATTQTHSGFDFVALWFSIVGVGLGFTMPGSMGAALGELSAERSGVGSALIQALRQVGGSIGISLLGTLLNTTYKSGIDLSGLPAEVAKTVQNSAPAGVMVATKLQSPALLDQVRNAFANAADSLLFACACIATLGILLSLAFLPSRVSVDGKKPLEGVESLT